MGGGLESQINTWNFVRKTSHFFKKMKCSKQPKKQNKINFYFSLSGVPNVRGGWVGFDVWDKVPNKSSFFLHLPLLESLAKLTWDFDKRQGFCCSVLLLLGKVLQKHFSVFVEEFEFQGNAPNVI